MRIQDNFVVGHGNLYRRSDNKLIRKNYEKHHKAITGVDDLKATLRAGQWAWPGGYPLFFITSDGAALSSRVFGRISTSAAIAADTA